MTRGIYTAATGMLAEESAQQVIAQNLANASTTGYKQDIPVFKSFEETLVSVTDETGVDTTALGKLGHGALLDRTYTDLSTGPLQSTGNNLDVALRDNAYLSVQLPSGHVYSRDGAMTLNGSGALVQVGSGLPVLDDRYQPITLPGGHSATISPDGAISVDGKQVAKLGLFGITQDNQPTKIGDNLIDVAAQPRALDGSATATGYVQSGYLEASNVSIVKEMVTMIACQRTYEANQKALQSQDDMLSKVTNDVGRVG